MLLTPDVFDLASGVFWGSPLAGADLADGFFAAPTAMVPTYVAAKA